MIGRSRSVSTRKQRWSTASQNFAHPIVPCKIYRQTRMSSYVSKFQSRNWLHKTWIFICQKSDNLKCFGSNGSHQCKLSTLCLYPRGVLFEHTTYGQFRLIRMGYVYFDTLALSSHSRWSEEVCTHKRYIGIYIRQSGRLIAKAKAHVWWGTCLMVTGIWVIT